jgi:voltage-gated potassium channel
LNRIKNFINLIERVFNSRRLRTILGVLIICIISFGYVFYLAEPQIKSFGDGVWWALVTITTVGYGDITPLTTLGKFVAGTLMFVGLGLIATVTAIVSAKFVANYVDHHTNDDVLEKLEELEAEIEKLKLLEEDELEKLDELDSEIQDIKDKFQ